MHRRDGGYGHRPLHLPTLTLTLTQAAERCYALLKQLKHDADESIADLGGVQPSMYRNA